MNMFRQSIMTLACLAISTASLAAVRTSQVRPSNWTGPATATAVPLNAGGATTISFNLPSAGRKVLTYSAECATDAPAGNTGAWTDITIIVNGAAVAATAGTSDAFCAANGTAGFDGWTRASVTVVISGVAGANTVRIQSTGQSGATGVWLSDTALVVHD